MEEGSVEEGSRKIDFFVALPGELVLQIVLHLPVRHILPCMAVSRAWLDTLTLRMMEPYWRQACVELGVPPGMVRHLLTTSTHPSARSVLYATLKQRNRICSVALRCEHLTNSYPYNVHYVCQYARGHDLVGTVYRNFKPDHIRVQRVEEGNRVKTVLNMEFTYPCIAENRVVWAHMYRQRYLLCAAASGIWSVFDTQPTVVRKREDGRNLLVQWRDTPMYDADIRIACCDRCGLVCTGKLVTNHVVAEPFWEFRAIEICRKGHSETKSTKCGCPLPKVTRFRPQVEMSSRETTSRRVQFGKKQVSLLSRSTEGPCKGDLGTCFSAAFNHCSSHLLLVQWANEVSAFKFCYKAQNDKMILCLSPTATKKYSVPCDNFEAAIMKRHGLNTEFVVSEDAAILGLIFQSSLVTWEVESAKRVSFARIHLDSYHYEEMKLISLGHIYSIVGLEFGCSIIVLGTRNGQPLLRCANFAVNHCNMVPPFIDFFSSVKNKWLSDISHPCATSILYWNKTNRSIEAVSLGEPPSPATETTQPAATKKGKRWQWPWKKQESEHQI